MSYAPDPAHTAFLHRKLYIQLLHIPTHTLTYTKTQLMHTEHTTNTGTYIKMNTDGHGGARL